MMPSAVPAVPGTAPAPTPAPVVTVVIYQYEGIFLPLFPADVLCGKPLEIFLGEGVSNQHVFVEPFIVYSILEALRCAVPA